MKALMSRGPNDFAFVPMRILELVGVGACQCCE